VPRILLVSGSLREGSSNAAALRTAAANAPTGVETTTYAGMASLPHFNPDDDVPPLAEPVAALRAAFAAADAVLFCPPESAGELPCSFKHLLDWGVGGGELYGKPVAWINVSGIQAPTRGADAHASLRRVLGYLGAELVEDAIAEVPVPRSAVEDGVITDPEIASVIAGSLAALAAHVATG
jgi:chromate reductase